MGSKMIEEFSHAVDAPVVAAGDWNTFVLGGKDISYHAPMFEPIKKAPYCSFKEMIENGQYSTFMANDYDYLRWFNKDDFDELKVSVLEGNEQAKNGNKKEAEKKFDIVRTLLEKAKNTKLKSHEVGVDGLGNHPSPENTRNGGILDMAVIYDQTKSGISATTTPRYYEGLSDHYALEVSISFQ